MTDVAEDGEEVLITQDRALVPMSLGCWTSFPWREDEGRACGDASGPQFCQRWEQYPSLPQFPAVVELSQVPREQRAGVGRLRKTAAAGRSGPKALLGVTAPHYRVLPKGALWFPAPSRLSVRQPCLDSEPDDDSTLRREHPAPRGLTQF